MNAVVGHGRCLGSFTGGAYSPFFNALLSFRPCQLFLSLLFVPTAHFYTEFLSRDKHKLLLFYYQVALASISRRAQSLALYRSILPSGLYFTVKKHLQSTTSASGGKDTSSLEREECSSSSLFIPAYGFSSSLPLQVPENRKKKCSQNRRKPFWGR